jgi:DNA repair exonuclease SbcCD ATPase subunit
MKITKVKIDRFAGIHNYDASFGENLNVIFGPNEIGKSTLMKAIKFGLFISPDITRQKLNSDFGFVLEDFLPKSGGDRIDVQIDFCVNGVEYKLRKTFGETNATKFSELHFGTTQLNDHKRVQSELNAVLGISGDAPKMNLKAWMDVVFANQASLSKTFDKINSNDTVKNSLAELMSQLEGISIEEFKTRVSNRLTALSQRWLLTDIHGLVIDRPELNGARGDYDNPFVREVGLILGSYYAWKNEQKALADRLVLEEQYDKIVGEIINQQIAFDEADHFINANQTFEQSLAQRNLVLAKLENENTKFSRLSEKFQNWVALETSLNNFEENNLRIIQDLTDLNQEKVLAIQFQQSGQLRQTVEQLSQFQGLIQEKNNILAGLQAISEIDLSNASQFSEDLRELQIQLGAQKLKVKLVAKKALSGVNQAGISEPEPFNLSVGDEILIDANTQFVLDTDHLKLEVSAGEEEVTVLNQRFVDFTTGLKQILTTYDVTTIDELNQLNRTYNDILGARNTAQNQFDGLLSGRVLQDLIDQVNQVNAIQVRSVDSLNQLIARKELEQNQLVQTKLANENTVKILRDDYVNQQGLMLAIANSTAQKDALATQLAHFPARPEEFETDEAFLLQYSNMYQQKDVATRELNRLLQSRAAILPIYGAGVTVEELTESVESLRVQYDSLVAEGHALLKIQQKVDQIEAAIGANPFGDLEIKLASYLERLSNGRYSSVEMNDVTPNGIQKDGVVLGNHLLSQGTSDILALATRLAMADYYLGDEDGFLMLDDPMTELDDERKVIASQLLKEVAEEKQVFVFTCHGNHRDLLEGHIIEFV